MRKPNKNQNQNQNHKNKQLAELKGYLRIDFDDDDSLLFTMMSAAVQYLENAGIPESDEPLYRLAVMLYVGSHYENRDGFRRNQGFSYPLQSIILQLKGGF